MAAQAPDCRLDARCVHLPIPDSGVEPEQALPAGQNPLPELRVELGEHHLPPVQPPQLQLPLKGGLLRRVVGEQAQLEELVPVVQGEKDGLIPGHRQPQHLPAPGQIHRPGVGRSPVGQLGAGGRRDQPGRLLGKPLVDGEEEGGALAVLGLDIFRAAEAHPVPLQGPEDRRALGGVEGYRITSVTHGI